MTGPAVSEPISTPTFIRADQDFEVYYPGEKLRFRLDAVNETATGMVHAEVSVTSELAILQGTEIAWDRIQLNSEAARSRLALAITRAYQGEDAKKPDPKFVTMLHEVSRGVVSRVRKGEEVVAITAPQRRQRDPYLLRPLIMDGQVNGIYGDGDVGKGWVAIACMAAMLHGGLPLGMSGQQIRSALYVDYETDQDEIEDRVARFCDGMGVPRVPFDYQRGTLPIQQEVRTIRRQLKTWDFIIWDSLGAGMTEHANDPGVAASCVNALRTFGSTVLFIDHVNKTGGQIGSVYKRNLCRNLWLAQKRIGETGIHNVTLFAKKGNNTGQRSAIGLDFIFDGEAGPVRVTPASARPPQVGGRPRQYETDAEKQKAYRERRKGPLRLVEDDDGPE